MKNSIRRAPWYSYTIAACAAVILYVLLSYFPGIWAAVKTCVGYFKPVIIGCVIAYVVNPMAKTFQKRVFHKAKRREFLSILLSFLIILLFLAFAVLLLIPQLFESISTFSNNLDSYVSTVNSVLENLGLASMLNLESVINSSESLLNTLSSYVEENIDKILSASVVAGKTLIQWLVGFILSIYFLAEKEKLKTGLRRLLRAIFGKSRYQKVRVFLRFCDTTLTRYIAFNLIDCLIVGGINAILMAIFGMQYIGLISFLIALSNLIPTFGPVIGAAIGALILLMVRPLHALIFLIFTVVLQVVDAYIIKPYLIGGSLGISGLWILIAVAVGGSMFGVIGMLISIPVITILDYTYRDYLLPWLEERQRSASPPAARL